MTDVFEGMAKKWPSNIVARAEITKFTGGAISGKFLANCDSDGTGIADRFFIGRRICYKVEDVIKFLQGHSREVVAK